MNCSFLVGLSLICVGQSNFQSPQSRAPRPAFSIQLLYSQDSIPSNKKGVQLVLDRSGIVGDLFFRESRHCAYT